MCGEPKRNRSGTAQDEQALRKGGALETQTVSAGANLLQIGFA